MTNDDWQLAGNRDGIEAAAAVRQGAVGERREQHHAVPASSHRGDDRARRALVRQQVVEAAPPRDADEADAPEPCPEAAVRGAGHAEHRGPGAASPTRRPSGGTSARRSAPGLSRRRSRGSRPTSGRSRRRGPRGTRTRCPSDRGGTARSRVPPSSAATPVAIVTAPGQARARRPAHVDGRRYGKYWNRSTTTSTSFCGGRGAYRK